MRSAVQPHVDDRQRSGPRRNGPGTWIALMIGTAVLFSACGDERQSAPSNEPAPVADVLSPRHGPEVAWTREGLFVYGGTGTTPIPEDPERLPTLSDAALVDPATGLADPVPVPPFSSELENARAIATTDFVVLVGIECDSVLDPEDAVPVCAPGTYAAAALNLDDREWEVIELPPELAGVTNGHLDGVGATSDGRAVLRLGSGESFAEPVTQLYWTFSPETGIWEQLPQPILRTDTRCMAGDTLVVAATEIITDQQVVADPEDALPPGGGEQRGRLSVALLPLDGTPNWELAPEPAIDRLEDGPRVSCGGDTVLLDEGTGLGAISYSLTRSTWTEPAEIPAAGTYLNVLWTGERFIFLTSSNDPSLAYDPAADAWREVPIGPGIHPAPIWVGSGIAWWTGGETSSPVTYVEIST